MTIQQIIDKEKYTVCSKGNCLDSEVTDIFCCDLLSIAMGKAPAKSAWVTVMANINTLAVASLSDIELIVLAEGVMFDEEATKKAQSLGITVLATDESVYHTAKQIDGWCHESNLL